MQNSSGNSVCLRFVLGVTHKHIQDEDDCKDGEQGLVIAFH